MLNDSAFIARRIDYEKGGAFEKPCGERKCINAVLIK